MESTSKFLISIFIMSLAACVTTNENVSKDADSDTQIKVASKNNAADHEMRAYLSEVRTKIKQQWHYPDQLATKGISGQVDAEINIHRDGSLSAFKITKSSGYAEMDQSLKDAVSKAAPFPPLPNKIDKDNITFIGKFLYAQ